MKRELKRLRLELKTTQQQLKEIKQNLNKLKQFSLGFSSINEKQALLDLDSTYMNAFDLLQKILKNFN